jgi:hypothetical protein
LCRRILKKRGARTEPLRALRSGQWDVAGWPPVAKGVRGTSTLDAICRSTARITSRRVVGLVRSAAGHTVCPLPCCQRPLVYCAPSGRGPSIGTAARPLGKNISNARTCQWGCVNAWGQPCRVSTWVRRYGVWAYAKIRCSPHHHSTGMPFLRTDLACGFENYSGVVGCRVTLCPAGLLGHSFSGEGNRHFAGCRRAPAPASLRVTPCAVSIPRSASSAYANALDCSSL